MPVGGSLSNASVRRCRTRVFPVVLGAHHAHDVGRAVEGAQTHAGGEVGRAAHLQRDSKCQISRLLGAREQETASSALARGTLLTESHGATSVGRPDSVRGTLAWHRVT